MTLPDCWGRTGFQDGARKDAELLCGSPTCHDLEALIIQIDKEACLSEPDSNRCVLRPAVPCRADVASTCLRLLRRSNGNTVTNPLHIHVFTWPCWRDLFGALLCGCNWPCDIASMAPARPPLFPCNKSYFPSIKQSSNTLLLVAVATQCLAKPPVGARQRAGCRNCSSWPACDPVCSYILPETVRAI